MDTKESELLRAGVPDRHKHAASPIGAVQNYIAEMERKLESLGWDSLNNESLRAAPSASERQQGGERRAPWPDFRGRPIHHGDEIVHPASGERGTVVYCSQGGDTDGDRWRVVYENANVSRLCLQIGDKGQAVLIDAPAPAATRAGDKWPHVELSAEQEERFSGMLGSNEWRGVVRWAIRTALMLNTTKRGLIDYGPAVEFAKLAADALAAQPPQAPPAAPSAEQGEAAAWVNPANVVSAAISRKRGGPFDQHTWSEQRTDYHSMPLFATQPAAPAGQTEQRLSAIVRWLETNQPDVFKRGLWDAIAAAPKTGGAND